MKSQNFPSDDVLKCRHNTCDARTYSFILHVLESSYRLHGRIKEYHKLIKCKI
jgi:hypothetical protein